MNQKVIARARRHTRIRKRVAGTSERPRMSVFRSARNFYAQIIDDTAGVTVVSASTLGLGEKVYGGNVEAARKIGQMIAQRATEKGITKVVMDRGGFLYHGRLKAFADAAREAGLDF